MNHTIVTRDEVRAGDELSDGSVIERTAYLGHGEYVAYLVDAGARFLPPEVIVTRRAQTTTG